MKYILDAITLIAICFSLVISILVILKSFQCQLKTIEISIAGFIIIRIKIRHKK